MAINPADFEHPETPKSFREFYMIYFKDSQRLNEKLDELDKSQQDDREAFEAVIDKWNESIAKQASCIDSLDYRLQAVEKSAAGLAGSVKETQAELRNINVKTNWFGGINATLTAGLAAILALFKN
jgi:chromosome segregation ATPase